MDSSSGFEHAGHINPSNAMLFSLNQGRKVIFGLYMIQGILIQNQIESKYIFGSSKIESDFASILIKTL